VALILTKEANMLPEFRTITLALPYRLGGVNCYLIKTDTGFILIDTGSSPRRADLEKELLSAGCQPGHLKLIILTHGDFDHTGNAAYLRQKFGTKVAMHQADFGMIERGDMFWNRSKSNRLFKVIAPFLFRFGASDRCTPDITIEDGVDLAEYGFDARVLSIPGHSKGSIGILTASGDLFIGDLLENTKQPALNSIMDDPATAQASVEKLKRLNIATIYPGHGTSFSMNQFIDSNR
jgi:glyoxylase-like metal-dependent hydrolase (beta-lactamase superfamily II)